VPKIAREIIVSAPLETTWALVSDMKRFSLCIPGCKEVKKISETEFDWVMEAKVLRTTRRVTARTRTASMNPPKHAEFTGEGRLFERSNHYKLSIAGTTDLEILDRGRTRILFAGDVTAGGVGGAIIDKVASGQMDELFTDFERNVKAALGDTGGTVLPAAASDPIPSRHISIRWWAGAAVLILAVAAAYLLA